jgi:uncharacterized protein
VNDFAVRFGPWALVTCASSGIGEAFARRLAASGMNLVLVARRQDRLERLATELAGRHGIEPRIVPVDLASDDFLPVVAEATHDLDIGLVVNNAGVLKAGTFLDHDLEDELYQLDLNARAMLVLAHHFGRRLRERRRGGMIFLGSTVAFAGVPGISAYAASKAHVLTFAEGFASEVAQDGIAVLALCPGPTSTEIWPSGATPTRPMRPEAVAEVALRSLGKRTTVVAGLVNRLITLSTRFAPRRVNSMIFGKVVGGMLKDAITGPGTAAPIPTDPPRTPAPTA